MGLKIKQNLTLTVFGLWSFFNFIKGGGGEE